MRKFILASLTIVGLALGVSSAANAQFHGGRHGGGGFHGGGHHGGGHFNGGFRPQVNPFFFGISQAPMYVQPQYGECEIRRQWVETPYGMKKRRVRVCY